MRRTYKKLKVEHSERHIDSGKKKIKNCSSQGLKKRPADTTVLKSIGQKITVVAGKRDSLVRSHSVHSVINLDHWAVYDLRAITAFSFYDVFLREIRVRIFDH